MNNKNIERKKKNESSLIRLNSYLSNSGISSRRKSDILIKSGLVKVNGKIIKELGFKVSLDDKILFNETNIKIEKKIYLVLNKPKGLITSTKKNNYCKNIVLDIIPKHYLKYRIYPVGRLDIDTTGVLIITNDGYLTNKLIHPNFKVKKIYKVFLNKKIKKLDIDKIKNGISLKEGKTIVDNIFNIKGAPKNIINIELHIGWKRIIKRIFKKLNYRVLKLDRILFSNISKKGLKIGECRILTNEEIRNLKSI